MSTESTATPAALEPLSEEECWRRLNAEEVGRLVVNVGHQPDIFPVNYIIEDGTIIIRSAEGTKLAAALMGQLVAFEIDELDTPGRAGWSVVVHGRASEDRSLHGVMEDQDRDLEPWAAGSKQRYIHITPTKVTGRSLPTVIPDGERT